MAEEQVLGFKPARRLEEVDDEHCERMQERAHRPRSCGDSTRRCDSQAGWDFRKGHGQHVFHSGYERAVGLRRDDPVLAAMGLKSVFLSARPIVLSLARSTMPSSTTLFSNNRKVQRARPLGGLEQA